MLEEKSKIYILADCKVTPTTFNAHGHGVIIKDGNDSATFLPQAPTTLTCAVVANYVGILTNNDARIS